MSILTYDEKSFYIDGERTKLVSGAMHYFRIVPEYWEDRLKKLKEIGCNCVETYICWSLHEKSEGVFDFSGWLDFGRFIDMAKELGLYLIVRPGPYICSELDFGGMPWWLLKYPDIELRCKNERFLNLCTPYLDKVCDIIRPRLLTNGGNIIFLQIENEYGTYGNDKEYLKWLKSFYESRKIDCCYLTSDGETELLLRNGTLDGVLASVNYRKDSQRCINSLKQLCPNQPGAVMELWNGIPMHWGKKIERRDIDEVKESVRSALEYGELVNLYMFHGGTTFGFMNGSLDFDGKFTVQMSSYDVDAPLDEYGRRTPKYYAEQEVICGALGKKAESNASDTVIACYDSVSFIGECPLKESSLMLKSNYSATPKPMEYFDQGYGYIIYETNAFVDKKGADLILPEIHDIAHIYIDGEYVQTLYRYGSGKKVAIQEAGMHRISIVVENLGRVNALTNLRDYKGLIGDVVLSDKLYNVSPMLLGFTVYSLPLDELPSAFKGKATENQPAFYKYEFTADAAHDTVMHLQGFTRGVAFVNGINLGRHWDIQFSENKLFVPAPFIKAGTNEVIIFDILHREQPKEVVFREFK